MAELIVLDPSEVATNRTSLDISSYVKVDGIDWGMAEIEAVMAQGERGSVPVDYTFPNRQITIPLKLVDVGATSFETFRGQLAAKVARLQAEGGWLKRQRGSDAPLFADVVNASLNIPDSTLQALGRFEPDAELVLECVFDFYEAELELTAGAVTGTAYASTVLTTARGDYPARCRIEVTDTATQQARGLIASLRSKTYSSASTAAPRYEAEALTPVSPAATTALTGASGSGSNTIRHNNLAPGVWSPVMTTNLAAGTYLTHVGTYRLWARVYTTSTTAVKVRAAYDVGDIILPEENDAVTIPGASAFYLVDLGTVRLDQDPIGTHRWQAQIQAMGAAGGENVYVDEIYLLSQDEVYTTLRAPTVTTSGSWITTGYDTFLQTAGALTSKVAPYGGTWTVGAAGPSTAEDGDADDFGVAAGVVYRTANSDSSLTNGRYVNLGTATYTDTAVRVDIAQTVQALTIPSGNEVRTGVVARYVNTDNWLMAVCSHLTDTSNPGAPPSGQITEIYLVKRVAGTVTVLGTSPLVAGQDANWHQLQLNVYASGACAVYSAATGAALGDALITYAGDATLTTGGALASGKVGIYDAINYAASPTMYRYIDNFNAWGLNPGSSTDDAVLFSGRKAQLRTIGSYREAADGGSYGPVSHQLNRLPRIPAEGLEGRSVEVFMRRSRGDLEAIPDSGLDALSFRVYASPSWVYAPGT